MRTYAKVLGLSMQALLVRCDAQQTEGCAQLTTEGFRAGVATVHQAVVLP